MRSCKEIFREFLNALMEGKESIFLYENDRYRLKMNMIKNPGAFAAFHESMGITQEYNVRFSTITNCMEIPGEEISILYATVHHLYAIDEENQLFPLTIGGKYRFVYNWKKSAVMEAEFDLEYLSGNTYLTRGAWKPQHQTERQIGNRELRRAVYRADSVKDTIYRFFWAMDTMDEELFSENAAEEIQITRCGVDGDVYGIDNLCELRAFLERDKKYYSQNQYSIHINKTELQDESHAAVEAWHLYPGDTENKHRGSQNKYFQFYNEIISMKLRREEIWKVESVVFRRKENPVPYGYDILEV